MEAIKMRQKYTRTALNVTAQQYEVNQGREDGFELYTKVVTNGWVSAEQLVHITRPDGTIVCPFIQTRRGVTFIREGDYIIFDENGEHHVCGGDKFSQRYKPIEE